MKPHSSRAENVPGGEAGFTLVEMLVAVTLLGMLSLVLLGGLHFGHRVWEATITTTARLDRIRALRMDVAQALSHAYPEVETSQADRSLKVKFDGEKSTVTFLAPAPDNSGALVFMSIGTRTTDGATKLLETRRLELARAADKTTVEPKLPPVTSLHFAYYGVLGPGETPDWHDSWNDQDKLPDLIRMSVTFADSRVHWPDLIVTPLIATDESCTFDLLARTCSGRAR